MSGQGREGSQRDVAGIQWIEVREAATHPKHRATFPQHRIIQCKESIVLRLKNPEFCLVLFLPNCLIHQLNYSRQIQIEVITLAFYLVHSCRHKATLDSSSVPRLCQPSSTISLLLIPMPGVRWKCGNVAETEEKGTLQDISHVDSSSASYTYSYFQQSYQQKPNVNTTILAFRTELCFKYHASKKFMQPKINKYQDRGRQV